MKRKSLLAELGLPAFFLLVTTWYMYDAYKADSMVENLLLIAPVGIVVLGLCSWILFSQFFSRDRDGGDVDENPDDKEKKEVSVLGAMLILAGYIILMDWIGFDIATFLFIAALMFLQGERRIPVLVGFSFTFAFFVSLFFEYMIPYPMPMLLGKEFLGRLL